ncbi:hypothetical protein COY27_06585 [Candidatus Woesearchaeota archaeon CG_4_10_14_0_2_um_filter_33_13]|nr:MAG: hypothetical protein COY27_06585 [Candidatus Woesearchaeota archaeon CG_4_10_14_0_2_um_filter_33_13]
MAKKPKLIKSAKIRQLETIVSSILDQQKSRLSSLGDIEMQVINAPELFAAMLADVDASFYDKHIGYTAWDFIDELSDGSSLAITVVKDGRSLGYIMGMEDDGDLPKRLQEGTFRLGSVAYNRGLLTEQEGSLVINSLSAAFQQLTSCFDYQRILAHSDNDEVISLLQQSGFVKERLYKNYYARGRGAWLLNAEVAALQEGKKFDLEAYKLALAGFNEDLWRLSRTSTLILDRFHSAMNILIFDRGERHSGQNARLRRQAAISRTNISQHQSSLEQATLTAETELFGFDAHTIIAEHGGKYMGVQLLNHLVKEFTAEHPEYSSMVTVPDVIDILVQESDFNQFFRTMMPRANFHFDEALRTDVNYRNQILEQYLSLRQKLSKVVPEDRSLVFRSSANYEYGGPSGQLSSVDTLRWFIQNPTNVDRLIVFYLDFLFRRDVLKTVPKGTVIHHLAMPFTMPDTSGFLLSSLQGDPSKDTIIEATIGHGKAIAEGFGGVYVEMNAGKPKMVTKSFEGNSPNLVWIEGPDVQYSGFHKVEAVIEQAWEERTTIVNGTRCPHDLATLELLDKFARFVDEKLGSAKLEYFVKDGMINFVQLDPSDRKCDPSISLSVPKGAHVLARTPYVSQPFRAQGRLFCSHYTTTPEMYQAIEQYARPVILLTGYDQVSLTAEVELDRLAETDNLSAVISSRNLNRMSHNSDFSRSSQLTVSARDLGVNQVGVKKIGLEKLSLTDTITAPDGSEIKLDGNTKASVQEIYVDCNGKGAVVYFFPKK